MKTNTNTTTPNSATQSLTVEQLRNSELFYRNLFIHSLDGLMITNENGLIQFASDSITPILGFRTEQLVGTYAFDYIHPDDRQLGTSAFMDEVRHSPKVKYISVRLKKITGEWFWCIVRGHNLMEVPYVKGMLIYIYDDTMRKITEDALRDSEKLLLTQADKLKQTEEEFRNLIQNLRQGVVVQDLTGKVIVCNAAAELILGVNEEKLIGTTSYESRWDAIHEDGRILPGHDHPAAQALKTKKPVRDVLIGVLKQSSGDRVWLLVNADPTVDSNGIISNVVITFTDISEQKRLSKELIEQEIHKQKQLTQATIDGQEKERLEMGKELHDNINQHLNTTRLYLEVARDKATGEVKEMINFSHKALADIIDQIRFLSQSLVPPTLGDIGLVESIHDICDSLIRTHKFKIDFFHRHFSEEGIPENMRLMLFRITQEQINNILRHAEAHMIWIKLESDAEYIVLTIADDGKGFDPSNYKKGLGLTNITNRASLFNGIVEIEAAKEKGCRLLVTIPLNNTELTE